MVRAEHDSGHISTRLIQVAHESFQAYDTSRFVTTAGQFIDDLSNWYTRLPRRTARGRSSGVTTP